MHLHPGSIYHIYNRGNNKQQIFFSDRNYYFFLKKIQTHLSPVCEIFAWCLLPNHFHLVISATESGCAERPTFAGKPMQEFSYQLGVLLSSYSQAINRQNKTTGSLFQQKTKAKCVNQYLETCVHYIHQNPVRAGLVNKNEEWSFSSFQQYIGKEGLLAVNDAFLLHMIKCDASTFCEESYKVLDELVLKQMLDL